jgi:tetratricopeptide (TPR) repeat protein
MSDDPASLFAQAKALHQSGQLDEAIEKYRRALDLKPDYAEAHNNLGNALGEAKRFEEAAASLRRAAELRPDLAPIHSNLGLALARLGRFEEAAESHRRAVALLPDLAPAHNNLAMALRELGRLDEAIDHYRRAVALKPAIAEFHHNLGNALKDLGQFEAAETAYRQAIDRRDDFPEAQTNLGSVLMELERHLEAELCHRRAIALNPGLASAHSNLGNVLMKMDRPAEALECFRRAIDLWPDFAAAHNHMGSALRELDRDAEALESFSRALELAPGFAAAHTNLGGLLLELGQRQEALESLDRAIAANPALASAHYNRMRAFQGVPGEADTKPIDALIAAIPAPAPGDLAMLHFALGAAREAQGRFEEAFASFQAGNRLRRGSLDYDENAFADRLARIRKVFTGAFLEKRAGSGSESSLPIFIVGMPRSGTSLIEQILASHPLVHGAGEQSPLGKLLAAVRLPDGSPTGFPEYVRAFGPDDFRRLGDAYVSTMRARNPMALRIVDKAVTNYAHIGLIRLVLPQARILHAVRDPLDVCVSAYCLSFEGRAQGHTYELGELGRHYRHYADLMAHWRRVLPAGAMLDVGYESLVEDLEGGVRRVLEYCDLPWDARCLDFHRSSRAVKTASTTQVRQAIYRSSIGRWRRFEKHLGPLIEALGPYAHEAR